MADGGKIVEFDDEKQKKLLIEGKKKYKHLHGAIYGTISSMLCRAKVEPIEFLVGLNPSFADLVKQLKDLRDVVAALAPMLEIDPKADIAMIDEYIDLAESLALSIDAQNSDSLCAAIARLDDKPYV